MQTYTLEEVQKHTAENDCWVVIDGKVYDVTKWLAKHPGGKKILLAQGGKDASAKFHQFHAPAILTQVAEQFCIGTLGAKDTTGSNASSEPVPVDIDLDSDEIPYFSPIPFANSTWYEGLPNPYYKDPSYARLRNFMRAFVEREFMPFAHKWDEQKRLPKEAYIKSAKAGILAAAAGSAHKYPDLCPYPMPAGIPFEKWNLFHEAICLDEVARVGSGGLAWGLGGGLGIGLPPIINFGTEEMKKRVVPAVLKGEKFACLCITEPSGGSDVANLTTTARESEDGSHWIVNGEKKWITNGVWADYFTVAVRTGGPGMNGISLLLLERTMPGVTTRPLECSGVWSSGTSYITFEDVKVPKKNLIGKLNKGFRCIMQNFNHERLGIIIQATRFSRCVIEDALIWAHKRKTFGKRLIDHDVIRNKLAHMARQIEATNAWLDSLLYQATILDEQEGMMKLGGPIALCKAQATQTMEYCCREAAQIFGGLAFTRGGQGERVERLYREVRAFAIPGGSEEIMLDLGIRQSVKVAQMLGAKL